jgi:hypothetical protein
LIKVAGTGKVNPVRNSSGALNPAGIIIKPDPVAEQRSIISNGVKVGNGTAKPAIIGELNKTKKERSRKDVKEKFLGWALRCFYGSRSAFRSILGAANRFTVCGATSDYPSFDESGLSFCKDGRRKDKW